MGHIFMKFAVDVKVCVNAMFFVTCVYTEDVSRSTTRALVGEAYNINNGSSETLAKKQPRLYLWLNMSQTFM